MGLRAFLASVTVGLCAVSSAYAADFSLKDTPFAVVPWNWGGFYAGWTAGYGAVDSTNFVSYNDNNPHGTATNNADGVMLGGTIGYNWMYTPNWVLGVEADMSWSQLEGTQHQYIYDGHDWSGGLDGFGTIRGRLGYAMGPNLVYATAGIAFLHSNEVVVGNNANETNFAYGWYTGYVVGLGVEHAFTERLSGKIEYLYASGFGDTTGHTGTVNGYSNDPAQYYRHTLSNLDIIRVGVNYKFY